MPEAVKSPSSVNMGNILKPLLCASAGKEVTDSAAPLCANSVLVISPFPDTLQGDHGGQRLRLVDFTLEVSQSLPTANSDKPLLPTLLLPKQNRADGGSQQNLASDHHGHPVLHFLFSNSTQIERTLRPTWIDCELFDSESGTESEGGRMFSPRVRMGTFTSTLIV